MGKYRNLAAPEEYISDFEGGFPDFIFDIEDLDVASEDVLKYVEMRLMAIAETVNRPLVIMLSGGVDSLLTLAVAARLEIDVQAFTFHWKGSDESDAEVATAKRAARTLGVNLHVVAPTQDEYLALVKSVIVRLETTEPWEVLAGLILLGVAEAADRELPDSIFISSAGADGLFLGGKPFCPRGDEDLNLRSWTREVRSTLTSNFRRGRFIPDFYERILGDESRHYKIWQTEQAVSLASRMHPVVVKGKQRDKDKLLLRHAAVKAGVPAMLVNRKKSPMQVSSGGLKAIEDLARRDLAHEFEGRTYSDPLTEEMPLTVARLFLENLEGR